MNGGDLSMDFFSIVTSQKQSLLSDKLLGRCPVHKGVASLRHKKLGTPFAHLYMLA